MPYSPQSKQGSKRYSDGWRAVNELVRADGSWSGRERNNCYLNLGDESFADVSYVTGLDFDGDGRSFAPFDYDQDGDLDLVIKFRTAPQIRILRNDRENANHSLHVLLRGVNGNRDAVGARVSLQTNQRRLLREVTAGSSYLTQYSRRLHFGLLPGEVIQRVEVIWPDGKLQVFSEIPSSHFLTLVEGDSKVGSFDPSLPPPRQPSPEHLLTGSPGTWLVDRIPAPSVSLPDLNGRRRDLAGYRGRRLLLTFWATWCPPCRKEMADLQSIYAKAAASGVEILAVSVDEPGHEDKVRHFAAGLNLTYPILHSDERTVGVYSILNRYLFDRRRDLGIPTTFLLDEEGQIVKVWVGPAPPASMLADAKAMKGSPIPFAGRRFTSPPARNYIDLGAALAERSFHEEARAIFQAAVRTGQNDPLLLSNLGTLLLESGDYTDAEKLLAASLKEKPDHLDARVNLAILALRQGNPAKALAELEPALSAYPDDAALIAMAGTADFAAGNLEAAEKLYRKALELEPDSPGHHYNLASVLARTGRSKDAIKSYELAHQKGRSDPELFNNLGVLHMSTGNNAEAKSAFDQAYALDPQDYSTSLNLALYFASTGTKEEALAWARRAQEIHPARPEAFILEANILAEQGNPAAARKVLMNVLKEHPDFPSAIESLQKLPESVLLQR